MSILDRPALEQSPLADLHAIASELSLDGYRRLRKSELIDAIIERQGGASGGDGAAADTAGQDIARVDTAGQDAARVDTAGQDAARVDTAGPDAARVDTAGQDAARMDTAGQDTAGVSTAGEQAATDEAADTAPAAPKRRSRRAAKPAEETGGEEKPPARRRRRKADVEEPEPAPAALAAAGPQAAEAAAEPQVAEAAAEPQVAEAAAEAEPSSGAGESREPGEPVAEGVVEVLSNGSGFLRVQPPEPSDADVYISAAQVKRCELVSGDRIAGPRRAPRRSERFASLVRVDTINGRPASEVADSAHFDELPAGFPVERLRVDDTESPLEAIESLTPIGRGSRVTICGPAQAGKTRTLALLTRALREADVQLLLVLAGARPEELADWAQTGVEPTAAVTLAGSADAQGQAVERVLDQGRRLAARGNHVVVLIDTVGTLPASTARRALANARRIVDGGSLTVIATSPEPLGGETTVIALDAELTAVQQRPVLDKAASWTMRPELLVGDDGAQRIARVRAEALGLAS